LRNETDRDDLDAAVRCEAARRFRVYYEASHVGGAKAIDLTNPKIDGGQIGGGDQERNRLDALGKLMHPYAILGREKSIIIDYVVGSDMKVHEVAAAIDMQSNRGRRYIGKCLVQALQAAVDTWGLAVRGRGPRKRPLDQWDMLGGYRSPELLKAMLRARHEV
jgi:hypothetical protein